MMSIEEICIFKQKEGRIELEFRFAEIGNDLVCFITGGRSHLGAASISEVYQKSGTFRASTSTLSVHGHQDGVVTSMISESLARQFQCNVLAVTGIHMHRITKEEIETVINLCKEAIQKFILLRATES